ncbi:amidohydrolase [Nakamurella lactea]|uniref:amidohydrolase n=1 Tax=Nakamurella lactea TaxID=459515 RepID=UPI0003FF9619|nr:amidohydrolase [Nakamurella lactea]
MSAAETDTDTSDAVRPVGEAVADLGAGRGPDWLDDFLAERLAELIALRRDVHRHPELGFAEHRTTELIESWLTRAGIEHRRLPGGTGVIAEIGSGSSVVALRADIDGLPLRETSGLPFSSTIPGTAHACGHDLHLTAVLGAGLALHASGALTGRVRLLFQPAEEVMPGGAAEVIQAGGLNDVDQAFALHCEPRTPVGRIGLKVGPITSTSDLIELRITGPGGHTSRPHLTADVVNALGTVITGLPLLLTRRMDPRAGAVLVWGAVQAGDAANAIPQEGVLRGTLRLMRREAWDGAEGLIRELVAGLLAPTSVSYDLRVHRGVPPVENDAYATALLRAGVAAALGPDAAMDAEQSTGSEDFAEMLEHAPGALARLGVWDGVGPQSDLHSAAFTADERAIPVGIRVLVQTVLAAQSGGSR